MLLISFFFFFSMFTSCTHMARSMHWFAACNANEFDFSLNLPRSMLWLARLLSITFSIVFDASDFFSVWKSLVNGYHPLLRFCTISLACFATARLIHFCFDAILKFNFLTGFFFQHKWLTHIFLAVFCYVRSFPNGEFLEFIEMFIK